MLAAMCQALSKTQTIHRDISSGNMILVFDPVLNRRRGVLIDWELSCPADQNGNARNRDRTVRFMCAVITVVCMLTEVHLFEGDFPVHVVQDHPRVPQRGFCTQHSG